MKAKVKKTLKAGSDIWEEGTILDYPFPPSIQGEIDLDTGTVELIEEESDKKRRIWPGGPRPSGVHGSGNKVDHAPYQVRVRRVIRS